MNEAFKKVKASLSDALELLKTEKVSDEALAKFESLATTLDEAEAELQKTSEDMQKTVKDEAETALAKTLEETMKKWADIYVTGESLAAALKDIKEAMSSEMQKHAESIEALKKEMNTPVPSKQVLEKVST